MPRLPDDQHLAATSVLSTGLWSATIAGPALAGLLVGVVFPAWIIGLDAVTFAALALQAPPLWQAPAPDDRAIPPPVSGMAYLLAAGTERADGGGLMPVGAGGGKWEWDWEDAEEYCSLCEEYVPRLVEGTRVCRRCRRMQRRMGKYGLSIAKYNAIWRAQGFQCALCGDNSEACDGGIPHEAPAIWQIDHDHACCGPSRIRKCCVRGILCKPCNLNRLPVYEKWPPELRDSPRINAYLDAPPAQRPEAEVIKGRDDQYLPTSWSFIKDEQYAGKPALADLPRGVP